MVSLIADTNPQAFRLSLEENDRLWYTGFYQTTSKGELYGTKKHTEHPGENR